MKSKRMYALMLAAAMALTSVPVPALADSAETTTDGANNVEAAASVTSWADLYRSLGVDVTEGEGLYDVVTSATEFSSFHAKDIPAVVSRVTDSEGYTIGLDGVVLSGKDATQEVKLGSAEYAYTSKYGFGEFDIVPDDTVDGYVWNDYFAGLYAATISDGTTTVGTVPWIDYYGESATAGPHYNKVQISVNSGEALASNKALVHRFDSMIDEKGYLKPGSYTVTLYSDGYQPLVAENIEVKEVSGVAFTANDVSVGAASVTVKGVDTLPVDFDAEYYVDGVAQTMSITQGRFTSYVVSLPENLAIGSHTVKVVDKNGKYVDLSASFLCTTAQFMAKYDAATTSLVKAEGITDDAWKAYLSAISTVTVNGLAYNATGRGAVKIVDADGKINLEAVSGGNPVFEANALNSLVVTATAYTSDFTAIVANGTVAEDEVYYVMMNVPFKDFFAAEYAAEDLEQVDTVTTATTSKFKMTGTTGLAQGTYNDGTNICGNTLYVKMTYGQYAAFFNAEANAQSDYYMSSATKNEPAAYKTLNADGSFSAMSKVKDSTGLSVTGYTTESFYGDHQISLEGVSVAEGINGEIPTYLGAVFTTSDGKSYAMYALENLWYSSRTPNLEIAWSVKGGKGLRKGHNNENMPLFYQYDMNGKTLTNVKLYTSLGVYSIDCNLPLTMYHPDEDVKLVEAKAATYAADGNIEYYICEECGRCYSDFDLTKEIALADTVIPKLAQKSQSMTVKASKTSLKGADLAKSAQKVSITVKDAQGNVSYKVSNSSYMSVKNGTVTFKKNTPAGTYKVTVKAAGTDEYKASSKTITIKVVKSAQPMKINVTSKTLKVSNLKKKAASFTLKVTSAQGKVTFKSSSKKVTVTSKGKVTVKKGTGKGSYKITVTAAGNGCFNKGTKTLTIKVK